MGVGVLDAGLGGVDGGAVGVQAADGGAAAHPRNVKGCYCTAIRVCIGIHQQANGQLPPQCSIRREPPPVLCVSRMELQWPALCQASMGTGECMQLYERVVNAALTCSRR